MPFFGVPAAIPLGVVEVAMRSGAAIVPIVLPRTSWGAEGRVFPEVPYDPEAPREAEAARVARRDPGHLRDGDPRQPRPVARARPGVAGARRMKVCLVSPYDYMHPGGVTEHVRHLADVLRERDHQVTVLAPSSRVGDDHGIPGYVRIGRSVPVKSNGSVARIALSFHLVRRVRALLDDSDFDVVHYHEPLVP